jgi:MerR family transcriptional regulator, light-induced transcriptional regulator
MNMLSTQELSQLMNVTETTIKRWADSGKIMCMKTPGGHRKFLMKDVVEFAEKNGYVISGIKTLNVEGKDKDTIEFAVYTHNYGMLTDIVLGVVLKGDQQSLMELFRYLYRNHIYFPTIVDEILRPVLVKIGDLWAQGKVDINQEHLASQAITEVLIMLQSELHQKEMNGYKALCACPEGELHEIGLRSVAFSLRGEGWDVTYLGANTPLDGFREMVDDMKPDLVCLSITHQSNLKSLKEIRDIGKRIQSYGGKYLVGGYYSNTYSEKDLHCDHIALSAGDAVEFARDAFSLKPGPKRHANE